MRWLGSAVARLGGVARLSSVARRGGAAARRRGGAAARRGSSAARRDGAAVRHGGAARRLAFGGAARRDGPVAQGRGGAAAAAAAAARRLGSAKLGAGFVLDVRALAEVGEFTSVLAPHHQLPSPLLPMHAGREAMKELLRYPPEQLWGLGGERRGDSAYTVATPALPAAQTADPSGRASAIRGASALTVGFTRTFTNFMEG